MKKINKIFLILLIIVMPFITNIQIVFADILKYGDVNEDSNINSGDVSLINNIVSGKITPTPIQFKLSDLNNDGIVNEIDQKIINYRAHGTPALKDIILDKTILEGSYEPVYDETCKSGYGEVEKCISTYTPPSEEAGLYVQKDDVNRSVEGKPTYYYRGAVENNYVSFGTYKNDVTNKVKNNETGEEIDEIVANAGDAILWRIVRVNEDGSIRVIAEHNIGQYISWANTVDIQTEVKYEFDGYESRVKKALEAWYNENIKTDKNVDNVVLTGKFCNDISGLDFSQNMGRGNAYNRMSTVKGVPIFTCPEGAIVVNSKVGLITADEAMYAGASINRNQSYLHNNTSFWTMTPIDTRRFYYLESGTNSLSPLWAHSNSDSTAYAAIRPVINLKADTVIMGGTGDKNDPYIVKTFKDEDRPTIMNTVNANTENIITSDKLNKAKENKTTLEYETYNTSTDNGKYLYTWKIDADNITTPKDINTAIDINKLKETDNQTYSRIKHAIKKEDSDVKYLTFTEDGSIGSTATITVDVSDMGSNVSVYKWDSRTNTILAVNPNQTIEDGKVSFEVSDNTNTKNYFITKGVLSESIVGNPNTGMMMFYIIGGISVLLIVGITYLIYSKKNNKFLKA